MTNSEEQPDAPGEPSSPPTTTERRVKRAIGPKLRKLLYVVFALLALLGANSGYLASITALGWFTGESYENYFYFVMFLGHVALGLLLIVPFLIFGIVHMRNTKGRRNRRAIRVGYGLFTVCLAVLITGLLLVRVSGVFDLKNQVARDVIYWLHVACPLVAGWLYWLHRLVGPKIKWKVGTTYAVATGSTIIAMVYLHSADPRKWNVAGPKEGEKYFEPSLARTHNGQFIPAQALHNDEYCRKCHPDTHEDWARSAHRNGSFNNPAYLTSIRETRSVLMARDGTIQAARWCAGCHDPVPFFSGAFDKTDFDDVNDPTAHAGITCTVCHAITNVNSNRGNADYTIEEPLHYPFAFSDNSALQWVNEQLIKAKPAFHKKTFLKPFHKTEEFCSTCHKVSLPKELNDYKEFLRGQNHYDPYLLSGVSGHGSRSFYYPPKAKENCNVCHMPLRESDDFAARFFDDSNKLKIHDHLFPGANTAIGYWLNDDEAIKRQQEFLLGTMRVDIFGIREGGTIDGELTAPLRPAMKTLEPGKTYLLETVIRTVKLGHMFTQGTVDSNEIWLDVTVKSGDRIIGRSGAVDDDSNVDPWAHRVNVFVIDQKGFRINRRNAQDIFTPLYNNQIPPGAGQTVHFELVVPEDITAPVEVDLRLQYRKFDAEYLRIIGEQAKPGDKPIRGHERGKPYVNPLPITTLAVDQLTFPVAGIDADVGNPLRENIPEWQRFNDYGIGLLLKGKQLSQAIEAFEKVESLGRFDGALNLARLHEKEGSLPEAIAAVGRLSKFKDPPPPPWTQAWISGLVNKKQNRLPEAEENFIQVLTMMTPEMKERGFDFSRDYVVRNLLGGTQYDLARQIRLPARPPEDEESRKRYDERRLQREAYLARAIDTFKETLKEDSENVTAHYLLSQLYDEVGDTEKADEHRRLHDRYRPDDNAQGGQAVIDAKNRYPAANKASESVVIYELSRGLNNQAPGG